MSGSIAIRWPQSAISYLGFQAPGSVGFEHVRVVLIAQPMDYFDSCRRAPSSFWQSLLRAGASQIRSTADLSTELENELISRGMTTTEALTTVQTLTGN